MEYFLFPSTLFCERAPHRVQTILGSCVAVCLFDRTWSYGAINHYMLPRWNGKGLPSPRFGDIATELLIEKMISMGSKKNDLVAKVFGGAHQHEGSGYAIGQRNVEIAEEILRENQIDIIARSTGGSKGRKIVFQTNTNQVLMKILETSELKKAV